MNNDLWWYLTRATGIVATLLAAAALVWGFFFSSRNTGQRLRAAWWLDLHNWLGGLALVFTAAHLVTAYLDANAGLGVLQVLVPGTVDVGRWAIGWGVIAFYLFAITVFTSWPKKRLRPRWWRVVHLTSVVGVALAGVHAYQAGSEATRISFQAGLVVVTGFCLYAVFLRLFHALDRRRTT
jgi:predicted ferric reductase